jgi:hypothetical protein
MTLSVQKMRSPTKRAMTPAMLVRKRPLRDCRNPMTSQPMVCPTTVAARMKTATVRSERDVGAQARSPVAKPVTTNSAMTLMTQARFTGASTSVLRYAVAGRIG